MLFFCQVFCVILHFCHERLFVFSLSTFVFTIFIGFCCLVSFSSTCRPHFSLLSFDRFFNCNFCCSLLIAFSYCKNCCICLRRFNCKCCLLLLLLLVLSSFHRLVNCKFCCWCFIQVTVPMLIMPSGEDPDHTPLKEVLDKKPFGDKCEYRRFDDMHHGFCAARW